MLVMDGGGRRGGGNGRRCSGGRCLRLVAKLEAAKRRAATGCGSRSGVAVVRESDGEPGIYAGRQGHGAAAVVAIATAAGVDAVVGRSRGSRGY